jgi:hypothetical protein
MSTGFPQFSANMPQQQLPSSGPQPTQAPSNGGQQGQSPQGQGSQRPAPKIMELLGNWHRVAGEMGQVHPRIASAMNKIASETQSALMVLAREHVQQGQGQGLPTDQSV